MGAWNSRLKSFWRYLRRNKKDGRERSQRAGAEDGADERVEGVHVHSPGSGSGAGRGERGRGTQEHKRTYVKAARCTAAHSRPVSSSSILLSSVKTRAFLGLVRRLRERSTKQILVAAPWQCWEGSAAGTEGRLSCVPGILHVIISPDLGTPTGKHLHYTTEAEPAVRGVQHLSKDTPSNPSPRSCYQRPGSCPEAPRGNRKEIHLLFPN